MNDANQNDEHVRDRIEAYVLGILEPEEQAAVEAHLERCVECQRLVAEAADAAHALPGALAAVSPLELPRSLREQVLERLREPALPPRRRSWRPLTAFGLAILGVAALFVVWNARLDDARSQEKELRARVARLKDLQPVVLDVVDSRHTVKRVLLPPEERAESRAYGKVFTRADMRDVVAMVNRLPQPPRGEVYHLWVSVADRPRLAGVLPVDENGFALLVFKAARPGPAYEDARVLLQPRGARRPSGVPFLAWNARS